MGWAEGRGGWRDGVGAGGSSLSSCQLPQRTGLGLTLYPVPSCVFLRRPSPVVASDSEAGGASAAICCHLTSNWPFLRHAPQLITADHGHSSSFRSPPVNKVCLASARLAQFVPGSQIITAIKENVSELRYLMTPSADKSKSFSLNFFSDFENLRGKVDRTGRYLKILGQSLLMYIEYRNAFVRSPASPPASRRCDGCRDLVVETWCVAVTTSKQLKKLSCSA